MQHSGSLRQCPLPLTAHSGHQLIPSMLRRGPSKEIFAAMAKPDAGRTQTLRNWASLRGLFVNFAFGFSKFSQCFTPQWLVHLAISKDASLAFDLIYDTADAVSRVNARVSRTVSCHYLFARHFKACGLSYLAWTCDLKSAGLVPASCWNAS